MIVYYNKKYLDEREMGISAFCPGFQFGAGFFTTMKYDNGKFHFLHEHITRLENSLKTYGYNISPVNYEKVLWELVERNGLKSARIKIIFFEGDGRELSIYIELCELKIEKNPKRLLIAEHRRGNNPIYNHKSLNFFENIYYHRQALKIGYSDFLFLDFNDNILETCYSNIFFIKDNLIITPQASLPILDGIIRQNLLNNPMPGYSIEERNIKVEDISQFTGCFTTNSIQEIVDVREIKFGNGSVSYSENLLCSP